MPWIAWLLACSSSPVAEPVRAPDPTVPAASPGSEVTAIDAEDPASCAPCHGVVVDEWRSSMHARAHHSVDPIYGAMRALVMEKQGADAGAPCLKCHSPRAPSEPESTLAVRGVTCATCHLSGDVMRAARDLPPGASPVHGTGPAAAELADGRTICLTCHDATTTPTGEAACTTGPEYVEGGTGRSCSDCHLPRVNGPSGSASPRDHHASHAFLGPHQAWSGDPSFLASAVELDVALVDGEARLTVGNLSGHAFPTGFPGRTAAVVVRGFDVSGAEIWRSPDDAPGTVFRKVYVDADGKPVPSPFSVRLAEDSRLRPTERRSSVFPVPAGVVRITAELGFRLMAPPLASRLGLDGSPEAEARAVRTSP